VLSELVPLAAEAREAEVAAVTATVSAAAALSGHPLRYSDSTVRRDENLASKPGDDATVLMVPLVFGVY
jgi:hypothetical protein